MDLNNLVVCQTGNEEARFVAGLDEAGIALVHKPRCKIDDTLAFRNFTLLTTDPNDECR